MKNKKKFAKIILFASLMIFGFQSCQKYSDGPFISLSTRTERVANKWKIDNYKLNGSDLTSLYSNYSETFTTEGDYSYQWGIISGTGKWAFQNNDEEIKINGIDNQSSQTLFIQKLEEKEFWYYYIDGNDKKEFHLIQY
jgi:hypothetical protein